MNNEHYVLRVCHLYGNLLNTYGDNGNILLLKFFAEKMGITFASKIVSIHEDFQAADYDLIFFGGGQDFEQLIVSEDIQEKKEELSKYIEQDGVMLAICGGYQLLGHYYMGANGEKIPGIAALDHYTLSQDHHRFIGDIEIKNEEFDETYYGFENHNGRTFLGNDEKPLGKVLEGNGNNGEDHTEGCHYKNVFGSYFHGPLLARNPIIAIRLIKTALEKRYGKAMAATLPTNEELLKLV